HGRCDSIWIVFGFCHALRIAETWPETGKRRDSAPTWRHARIGNGTLKKTRRSGDALLTGGFARSQKWRAAIDQYGDHRGFVPAIGDRHHSLLHSSAPGRTFEFPARYAEGMQRMIVDKAMAKQVIQKYSRETDPDVLESTYRYGLDYIAPVPYPAKEGIVEILKQSNHPKAKSANPDDFIDMSLVKKLEEGGFFRETNQR